VVGDGVVVAAVDGEVVGEDRQHDGVAGEGVAGVRCSVGPQRQAVVAGVADVAIGNRGVGDAAVEVDAVGCGVLDADIADPQAVERAGQPHADLGVLDPQIADSRVGQRAANAVDVGGVHPLGDLAEDGEVRQVHVGAGGGCRLTVDADAGTVQYGVPL